MKYRMEYWLFKTPQGITKKAVCVVAGDNERQRLLEKAAKMEKMYNWKLL